MKIHIVDDPNLAIDGYNVITLNRLDEQFASISNNSCEFILANNIFDYVESKNIADTIQKLLLKLRINGKMSIGGKDIYLFCKAVKNGLISEQEASDAVANSKSLVSQEFIQNILKQLGLKYTVQLNGIYYEFIATR